MEIMSLSKEETKKIKRYVINEMRRMKKRQLNFFERIEGKKDLEDYLTIEEIEKEFNISRSTFNRYRQQGLKVLQNGYNGRITVKKGDYVEFLKNRELWYIIRISSLCGRSGKEVTAVVEIT